MNALAIFKVNALPAVLEPSALYFVPGDDPTHLEIYLSDAEGATAKGIVSHSEILSLVSSSVEQAVSVALGNLGGVVTKQYRFGLTMQLVVQHNMNTMNYTVNILSNDGARVYAPDTPVNSNQFTVDFTAPEEGIAYVTFYL